MTTEVKPWERTDWTDQMVWPAGQRIPYERLRENPPWGEQSSLAWRPSFRARIVCALRLHKWSVFCQRDHWDGARALVQRCRRCGAQRVAVAYYDPYDDELRGRALKREDEEKAKRGT